MNLYLLGVDGFLWGDGVDCFCGSDSCDGGEFYFRKPLAFQIGMKKDYLESIQLKQWHMIRLEIKIVMKLPYGDFSRPCE